MIDGNPLYAQKVHFVEDTTCSRDRTNLWTNDVLKIMRLRICCVFNLLLSVKLGYRASFSSKLQSGNVSSCVNQAES